MAESTTVSPSATTRAVDDNASEILEQRRASQRYHVNGRVVRVATCHPEKRHHANGLCKTCCQREWRKENPHKVQEANQKAYESFAWERQLLKFYGIDAEEYARLLRKQNGRCAICGTPPKKEKLSVDHCHKTKTVRGLLCRRCNLGLGYFDDNPQAFLKVLEYLGAVN